MIATMLMASGLLAAGGTWSVHVDPPETIATTSAYDSGARSLVLRCDRATRGVCVFVVADGPVRRRLAMRPRGRTVLTGVSPHAKVCARERNPRPCDWLPVGGAT